MHAIKEYNTITSSFFSIRESRRRRTEGHDWCILKLGIPGVIRAIEVDTAFFTGNFSPQGMYYIILCYI